MTDYLKLAESMESPKRFNHSVNVAKTAVELAKKYGADIEKAYLCGILHDIMKDRSRDEQLQTILSADIIMSHVEYANPKLWHSIAGYAYLKTKLGITDLDTLNAVRYHTTARADMSVLEKVIYIADYISEERDYNGVDEMRKAAQVSLEQAMFIALQFTISDLSQNKKVISPNSLDAYNQLNVDYYMKGKIV